MSEEETNNVILNELLALDTTFTEKKAELGVLISKLQSKKPNAHIDEVFVSELRARLILRKGFHILSPYSRAYWWATHLAPIGAIAVLFLILVPQEMKFTEQELLHDDVYMESTMESPSADDASLKSMDAEESISSDMDSSFNTLSLPQPPPGSDERTQSQNYFSLPKQNPSSSVQIESVTLTEPGFIVVHHFGPNGIGQVVGISPLQNSGTTVGITIFLRSVSRPQDTYYVGLYHDNGNGVFSANDDIPVIDVLTGTHVSTLFTINDSGNE